MTSIENHGDVANQTAISIQNMSGNIENKFLIMPSLVSTKGIMPNRNFVPNNDYYNLFVIGDETFSEGHFLIPKDKALTESMKPEDRAQFSALTDDAIERIKTFPSLFASKNHQYGKTDNDHEAIFGFVSEVRIQDDGIKIYLLPSWLWPIPQQRLNEITFQLAIESASMCNEFDRPHWSIKRIPLVNELKAAGINIPMTT